MVSSQSRMGFALLSRDRSWSSPLRKTWVKINGEPTIPSHSVAWSELRTQPGGMILHSERIPTVPSPHHHPSVRWRKVEVELGLSNVYVWGGASWCHAIEA